MNFGLLTKRKEEQVILTIVILDNIVLFAPLESFISRLFILIDHKPVTARWRNGIPGRSYC